MGTITSSTHRLRVAAYVIKMCDHIQVEYTSAHLRYTGKESMLLSTNDVVVHVCRAAARVYSAQSSDLYSRLLFSMSSLHLSSNCYSRIAYGGAYRERNLDLVSKIWAVRIGCSVYSTFS